MGPYTKRTSSAFRPYCRHVDGPIDSMKHYYIPLQEKVQNQAKNWRWINRFKRDLFKGNRRWMRYQVLQIWFHGVGISTGVKYL